MNDVVILSPSRFSLYTICVTELLRRNNVNIKAIIVRRLFNPNRLLSEFSRDGSRLIKKIWKKLVLQKKAYRHTNYETILDLMKSENIQFTKVEDFFGKLIPAASAGIITVINTIFRYVLIDYLHNG